MGRSLYITKTKENTTHTTLFDAFACYFSCFM